MPTARSAGRRWPTTARLHSDAIAVADAHGRLYHGDILKTQLILDRY